MMLISFYQYMHFAYSRQVLFIVYFYDVLHICIEFFKIQIYMIIASKGIISKFAYNIMYIVFQADYHISCFAFGKYPFDGSIIICILHQKNNTDFIVTIIHFLNQGIYITFSM